jgi:hypothetical protein
VGLQRSSGSDSMEAMAIAILVIQRKPLKRTIITSLMMKWKATMWPTFDSLFFLTGYRTESASLLYLGNMESCRQRTETPAS